MISIVTGQENQSADDYAVEFTQLSHFAPTLVANEEDRTRRFLSGLDFEIHGRLYAPCAFAPVESALGTFDRAAANNVVAAPCSSLSCYIMTSKSENSRKTTRTQKISYHQNPYSAK